MASRRASGAMAGAEAVTGKSDLGVRTASAVVMLAVGGAALWMGGWAWTALVLLVALGVLWEWLRLAHAFADGAKERGLWNGGGLAYVTVAAITLVVLRQGEAGSAQVLALVGLVIGTDVGAYFAGRTFGGPKIAPQISPSKTWAGLFGGMIGASVMLLLVLLGPGAGRMAAGHLMDFMLVAPLGAVIAQAGDFFESWMKRRAGVKDSGALIPGHGGLFDRVDGLLAVSFAVGFVHLLLRASGL